MLQFQVVLLLAFSLVVAHSRMVQYNSDDEDEVIDLQELLVGVSKSLNVFSQDMRKSFQDFTSSLNTLKQDMKDMKIAIEDVRKSSTQSSVSNDDIKKYVEKSSVFINTLGDDLKKQLEKSSVKLTSIGQEVKDHLQHSSNTLVSFGQVLDEQKTQNAFSFKKFEALLRELADKKLDSCPALPEKYDTILTRLNDIKDMTNTIKSTSQVVKEEIQKSTSSINTIVQNQKVMKETLTVVKDVTNKIHTNNDVIHQESSTCSSVLDKFLKEQEIWKETLNGKIDQVVQKYGKCDKDDGNDGDGDNGNDGDGDNETKGPALDCDDLYRKYGVSKSGVYNIRPNGYNKRFPALCDFSDNGGWTVIQKRGDFGNDKDYFVRTWNEYKNGFGDLTKEFWLGNDRISSITGQREYQVKIDLWDHHNNHAFARYNDFRVDDESAKYMLHVRGFSGTAGDALNSHDGLVFSTQDRDSVGRGCPGDEKKAGWWYGSCAANLNGLNLNKIEMFLKKGRGIKWTQWIGADYSLAASTIKIRPKGV